MQPQTKTTAVLPRSNCIGCRDCKGLCRELVELAFLPETVLRVSTASR